MTNKGFTLVELLIVVAIICVLVALLLPVILKARQSAYQVYCMSNLKTLGVGYHAYAQDFNGYIVPLIRNSTIYKNSFWDEQLQPYAAKALSYEAMGSGDDHWIRCPSSPYSTYNSYAQNANVGFKDYLGSQRYYPSKFSQLTSPTNTALVGEMYNNRLFGTGILTNLGINTNQASYLFFPTPHYAQVEKASRVPTMRPVKGIANMLFCDGRVESIHYRNNWLVKENIVPE